MCNYHTGCKGTGSLNRVVDLITPLSRHNHNSKEYTSDVFNLKSKCKKTAMHSQTNLRQVFNDATSCDPSACQVTFPDCESAMYSARRRFTRRFHEMLLNFAKCTYS